MRNCAQNFYRSFSHNSQRHEKKRKNTVIVIIRVDASGSGDWLQVGKNKISWNYGNSLYLDGISCYTDVYVYTFVKTHFTSLYVSEFYCMYILLQLKKMKDPFLSHVQHRLAGISTPCHFTLEFKLTGQTPCGILLVSEQKDLQQIFRNS